LHDFDALLVQPNHLLAPFVQLIQCLISCVFFFHDKYMAAAIKISRLYWAESIVVSQLTTERARSHGGTPVPAFQMPFQPVTDLSRKHPSYSLFREGFGLTEAQMDWYKGHYLTSEEEALDTRVSPLLTEDLSGLPPALVVVAGFDPLRDEALLYAQRLQNAGVPVSVRLFPGATHAELNATGVGSTSRDALFEIVGAMNVLIAFARTRKTIHKKEPVRIERC
jgi:acetyl esterase